MTTPYNAFAGGDIGRIAALSDGVFAFAATVLVLDVRTPEPANIHSEIELLRVLAASAPRLLTWLLSLLTLGIFWVGQQTQLNHLARSNRDLTWMHLGFLFAVTLVPFTTSLMAAWPAYRTALLVYWFNILLLGASLLLTWRCALAAGLIEEEARARLAGGVERRIVTAQALYALGAALCLAGTYWSLGFILLVQLNYALAPRLPLLRRL